MQKTLFSNELSSNKSFCKMRVLYINFLFFPKPPLSKLHNCDFLAGNFFYLSVSFSLYLSLCLYLSLSPSLFVYLPVCMYHLSLSLYVFFSLSIYLSINLRTIDPFRSWIQVSKKRNVYL